MLSGAWLVAYTGAQDARRLVDSILDALMQAARPRWLRFAVPMQFAGVVLDADGAPLGDDLQPLREVLGENELLFYDESQGMQGLLPLLGGVSHVLWLLGAHAFGPRWDAELAARLNRCEGPHPLLTATISAPARGMAAQAFLPALRPPVTEESVRLGRGLPIVCGAAPVRTMLVDPALVFGEASFLSWMETDARLLSIAAHVADVQPYALEAPLLWPVREARARRLYRPGPEQLPGARLGRFEQLAGFSFAEQTVSVRASLGLFAAGAAYPQRFDEPMGLLDRVRQRRLPPPPLMVTAFVELPAPRHPLPEYLIRFDFLRALENLPLWLYAGGPQERVLRQNYLNTLSYPDLHVLPKALLADGMSAEQHFRRSKWALLARTLERFPEASHVAWIDFDALRYPLCPTLHPVMTHLQGKTIHLAAVNGEPDAGLIVLPRQHARLIAREADSICQVDAALGRDFSENALIKRLLKKLPDLFTLHPMPRRGLLIYTCFHPQALSEETRQTLYPEAPSSTPKEDYNA